MATIGADPELGLFRGEAPIAANEFFRLQGPRTRYGDVGTDGCGRPMELRPAPSGKPRDVMLNIGQLLLEARKTLPPTIQIGLSSYVHGIGGIGGHLHAWGRTGTRDKLDLASNQGRICLGLSLLWALEDPETGTQRRAQGYGGINDWRRGVPGREFRSPGPDWLASPSLTYHTLSFFQSLVDNVERFGRDIDELNHFLGLGQQYWLHTPRPVDAFRHTYLDGITNLVKPIVKSKDLAGILFFAEKLPRLREGPFRIIRLDADKWGRKIGCLD